MGITNGRNKCVVPKEEEFKEARKIICLDVWMIWHSPQLQTQMCMLLVLADCTASRMCCRAVGNPGNVVSSVARVAVVSHRI